MSIKTYLLRKKFWLKDFLHGSPMWRHYQEVKFIYNNIEAGECIRQKKLDELIKYVQKYVPFYRDKNFTSLSDFPIVNKQVYLSQYNDFLAPSECISGQDGDTYVVKTSGSTGTPFAVPQDTNCRIRRIATIKFENDLIGFHSFEPMMHLRSLKHYYSHLNENFSYNKDLNIWYVDNANLTSEKIEEILYLINKNKIKVIRGYMTTLDIITRYAVNRNITLNSCPTFISVGELLQEPLRKRVAEDLKCKIISQYGNEENGIFGQSAINKIGTTIKLNRANCIVEILNLNRDVPAKEGEIGRIVITDLTNYAFPMIRYDIGDLAMQGEKHKDGTLLSIANLSGRKTDMIYKPSGEYIDFFNSISSEIFNNPKINQWQFIQKDKNLYTLRLNVNDNALRSKQDYFVNIIKKVLGNDANVLVEFVDDIPTLNSGKRKIVVSEYNPLDV